MIKATRDDLANWREEVGLTKPVPANVGVCLYQAALIVADYLQWCVWDPEKSEHVEAIKDAQCAQAATWIESDIDPMTEGFTSNLHNVQSASLLGGSFTNSGAGVTGRKRTSAADTLLPSPLKILQMAGIQPAPVQVVG